MTPLELPDWFIKKYTKSDSIERPATGESQTLHRQFLSLEIEDTQQEREKLHGSILESTRKRIPPEVLTLLSNKSLTESPLSPLSEGQRVFTNEDQLDKMMIEVPEEGRIVSFNPKNSLE